MGLRGRVFWLWAGLLTACLAGLAWVAGGLLNQAMAEAASLAAARPEVAQRLREAVAAAENVTWLAAAALLALALGLMVAVLRPWLFGPLRSLERQLERDRSLDSQQGDLLARVEATLISYRARLSAQARDREGQLDVVDAYRATASQAQERLAAADRLTIAGQLALGAAHEVGGPLSIAVVCMDSLKGLADATDPEAMAARQRYREQALEALERVDGLLRDLSAFGHPEQPGTDTPAPIGQLLARILRLGRLHKRCRSATIELAVEPAAGTACARIRPRHLEQVILNLLINAADATEGAGTVEIAVRVDAGRLHIAVQDDGPGVAETLRQQVFAPFFTTKAQGHGSGLGLAVSRRLIEEAGGRLELLTSGSEGARFEIDLPEAPLEDPSVP